MTRELIVVGGGVNGLVAAAYLAKAGARVLVLDARGAPGGLAATEESLPGYRCDVAGHDLGWLLPKIVKELGLARAGLELQVPEATLCAPLPDGRALTLWTDPARTAEDIARFSPEDARRWPAFTAQLAHFAGVLERLYGASPPQVPDVSPRDLAALLGVGRRLRSLGRREMMEFLRVAPMSIGEWLDDWFATDALKGAVGAGGVRNILQGPFSAGTAFGLVHHQVGRPAGAVRAAHLVTGGAATLGLALAEAARSFGAEIRSNARVREIVVSDGRAIGVALETGEHLAARTVVSSLDPRRTLTHLVAAEHFDPEFLRAVGHIRCRGATAIVHLALRELPHLAAVPGDALRCALCIAPSLDYLERAYDDAKYGRVSQRPFLEARIPTVLDPSLAPAGRHLMTVRVQYAPYHRRDRAWDAAARDHLADLVIATLGEVAPNLPAAVEGRHVVTPRDLEERFGLTEGHLYQGELALDQILFMRPVAGWAQYRTPVAGLYLCGAGTHPGGGLAGAPGRNAARELLREARP